MPDMSGQANHPTNNKHTTTMDTDDDAIVVACTALERLQVTPTVGEATIHTCNE